MWKMPLHLHANQKFDYDMMMMMMSASSSKGNIGSPESNMPEDLHCIFYNVELCVTWIHFADTKTFKPLLSTGSTQEDPS